MTTSQQIIAQTDQWGAHHYNPLPVVIAEAEGVWVTDVEGKRYIDMLSGYSALSHGHRHPRIIEAAKRQMDRVTLTARAFHNDQLGHLLQQLSELCGMDKALMMNSGAEAVETAIKLARKWGYQVKGVPRYEAEIIVCDNNFHGRTTTVISFSSEETYKHDFGPLTPGFRFVPFGDSDALEAAITPNTVAFLVEPIQGEGGINVPSEGYLRRVREICDRHNILLLTDEIQVGLGRTGKLFCFQHDDIEPDILILGKALGGGVLPVSAIVTKADLLGLFVPGEHGSTFGANPLACAVASEALSVLVDEHLTERAAEMGDYLRHRLNAMESPHVVEVRGKGLLVGVALKPELGGARPFCLRLLERGVLCKETHKDVIRFAPPLTITREEMDWALERVEAVLLEDLPVAEKA
ncbi:MAG: ornithine--oxo-acid transaminase [Anaerolineae bacterium]|nr:ornithine--oxo-acid transaminase [Anaerolineae bacterium]